MRRGFLIWNIILTVLLLSGFSVGYFMQYRFINHTNERIYVLNENLKEMNEAISEYARVINEQTNVINENANLVNDEYLAAIKANQEAMNEMNALINRYREIINRNALYFEGILENLEDLSLIIAE